MATYPTDRCPSDGIKALYRRSVYATLPLLAGLAPRKLCDWCKAPEGEPHREHCRALEDTTSGAKPASIGTPSPEAQRPPESLDVAGAVKYASTHARRVSPGCPHLLGNCKCDVPHYLRCDYIWLGTRCAKGDGHSGPHVYREPP